MVIQASTEGHTELGESLKRHFGFKRDLVLRAEHVFYHELVKLVPELASFRRVLDETVLSKLLGKAKSVEDRRPDYFHLDAETNVGLHGEFDEKDDHEKDERRLQEIAHCAGCGADRTYYFRVKGHLGTPQALCERIIRKHIVYYRMTDVGMRVVAEVAAYVRWCIERMRTGEPPSSEQGEDVLAIRWF
jgi:hypothetical protein